MPLGKSRLRAVAACALVFAFVVGLGLLGYGQLLVPGRIPYSAHSDVVAYHLAAKHVLHRNLEAGRGVPYWRADELAGTPAFTNPNALYTHPLHLLYHVLDPARATGPTMLLIVFAGGLAFYLVAVSLQLGRAARVFMALAGLFNFKVIVAVYAGWLAPLCGIVAFPLLFASAFALAQKPRWGAALGLSASGALCLHSGQLQFVYYAGWFALAFLLVVGIRRWRDGQRSAALGLAGHVVLAALLAIGMSLYLLGPMVAEATLVSRARATNDFLQSVHTVGLRHLLTLFAPEALGTPLDGSYAAVELWEDVAYFGLVPLLLAGLAVAWRFRSSPTRFLLVGFVLSLLLALDSPIVRVAYAVVPGMRFFRLPGRFLFLTAFFGIALAGIGFQALCDRLHGVRRLWPVPAVLIAIVAAEGVLHARRYVQTRPAAFVEAPTGFARFLAGDPGPFRCAPVGRSAMAYGAGARQGLQLITGYEPYNLSDYQDLLAIMHSGAIERRDAVVWTDVLAIRRWDILDALNVKYLLSSWPLALPEARFRLLRRFEKQPLFVFYSGAHDSDVWLYENLRVRPRAYFADRVETVPDETLAARRVAEERLDELAVVVDSPQVETGGSASVGDGVHVTGAADGRLSIETRTEARRFLVISEVWHPGWRGLLDGVEVPLRQTDVALMGAWIPPGTHHLQLVFRPLHLGLSIALTLLALVVFAAMVAWRFRGCLKVPAVVSTAEDDAPENNAGALSPSPSGRGQGEGK